MSAEHEIKPAAEQCLGQRAPSAGRDAARCRSVVPGLGRHVEGTVPNGARQHYNLRHLRVGGQSLDRVAIELRDAAQPPMGVARQHQDPQTNTLAARLFGHGASSCTAHVCDQEGAQPHGVGGESRKRVGHSAFDHALEAAGGQRDDLALEPANAHALHFEQAGI